MKDSDCALLQVYVVDREGQRLRYATAQTGKHPNEKPIAEIGGRLLQLLNLARLQICPGYHDNPSLNAQGFITSVRDMRYDPSHALACIPLWLPSPWRSLRPSPSRTRYKGGPAHIEHAKELFSLQT